MNLYSFRPFELKEIKYSSTKRSLGRSKKPKARSGHRIACNDENLYLFGGYNFDDQTSSHTLYPELLKFNFVSKEWTLVLEETPDMPLEVASISLFMHRNSTLMIYGGTSYPFGVLCSNSLSLCDINKPSFKKVEVVTNSSLCPPPQYGTAIFFRDDDHSFYTVGGTDGYNYSADVYKLDIHTKEWEIYQSKPEINEIDPKGRYRHEIAFDNQKIYVFGGGSSLEVFALDEIPAFIFATKKWIMLKTKPDLLTGQYPLNRKCHSLVQLTTKNPDGIDETEVIIAGGCNLEREMADIWKFSLSTLQWSLYQQTSLPYNLQFHDACVTADGAMYIFGGIFGPTRKRSNALQKMWTKIPKLSVICFEAIIHYFPKLYKVPPSVMLEKGIPLQFVNRAS